MAWQKSTTALVELFEASLPPDPSVARRQMFGCPCVFVGGNMFAGLHEQRLFLRLPQGRREQLLQERLAVPFSVMGRTMREYVAIPNAVSRKSTQVTELIAEAFAYARTLPAKVSKARASVKRV